MIRAIVLFSVVTVSLLSTACQKEQKRPTPAQFAANQNRGLVPVAPGAPIVPGAGSISSGNNSGLSLGNDNNNTSTQTPSHVARSQRDDGTLVDDSGTPAVTGSTPALTSSEGEDPDPAPVTAAAAQPQAAPPAAAPPPAPDLSAQTAQPPAAALDTFPIPGKTPAAEGGTSVAEQSPVKAPAPSTPVHTDDPQWTPGLPREPIATPNVTHNGRSDGAIYTDSNDDELMKTAWAAFNASKDLVNSNTELAKTIAGVQLANAEGKSYTLTVDIVENNNQIRLIFSGPRLTFAEKEAKIESDAAKKKTPAHKLKADLAPNALLRSFYLKLDSKESSSGLTYRYSARVLCSDEAVETCQNATIEIRKYDLHAKNQKTPLAEAFIVHRLGPAIVTLDRSPSPSSQVTAFTQILAEANGAGDVWMRTWAVAGGGAKYDIILVADEDKSDVYFSKSLIFTGELVVPSQKTPEKVAVIDHAGHNRETPFKDKSIELKNADGNGALNFNIVFLDDGTQRISVTSNFAKTHVPEVKTSDATLTKKH